MIRAVLTYFFLHMEVTHARLRSLEEHIWTICGRIMLSWNFLLPTHSCYDTVSTGASGFWRTVLRLLDLSYSLATPVRKNTTTSVLYLTDVFMIKSKAILLWILALNQLQFACIAQGDSRGLLRGNWLGMHIFCCAHRSIYDSKMI